MSTQSIGERSDLTYRALADPTRRHLLRLLDDSEEPLEVGAMSEQVGLHPNTVRDHLNVLSQAGLVTRTAEKRTRPGRPKMLYEAAPHETRSPGAEGYRFLAEVQPAIWRRRWTIRRQPPRRRGEPGDVIWSTAPLRSCISTHRVSSNRSSRLSPSSALRPRLDKMGNESW